MNINHTQMRCIAQSFNTTLMTKGSKTCSASKEPNLWHDEHQHKNAIHTCPRSINNRHSQMKQSFKRVP